MPHRAAAGDRAAPRPGPSAAAGAGAARDRRHAGPRRGSCRRVPARRHEVQEREIVEPRPVDDTERTAAVPPPTAPIWPTTSPGGSSPPRPEVSTRSPTAKVGVERQEAQLGLGRLSPSQDRVVARALDDDRDARVEVGDQQDARAAPADIDHPPGQPLGRHRGHARWRRPARRRRRAAACGRTPRRNRRPRAPWSRPAADPIAGTAQHPRSARFCTASLRGFRLPAEQPAVLLAQPRVLVVDGQKLADAIEARADGGDRLVRGLPGPARPRRSAARPRDSASFTSVLPSTSSTTDRPTSRPRAERSSQCAQLDRDIAATGPREGHHRRLRPWRRPARRSGTPIAMSRRSSSGRPPPQFNL